MTRFTILPMEAEHIPAVLRVETRSNPAPWSEASFRSELKNPQAHYLVALAGNEVAGYCGAWDVIDELHITNIAVDPQFRRQGLGKKLMIETLNSAKKRGMRCSTLEVRAGNEAAIKLYEKLGFQKCATRKGYYPVNSEDAIVMWLYDLESRDWSI